MSIPDEFLPPAVFYKKRSHCKSLDAIRVARKIYDQATHLDMEGMHTPMDDIQQLKQRLKEELMAGIPKKSE